MHSLGLREFSQLFNSFKGKRCREISQTKIFNPNLYKNRSYYMYFIYKNTRYIALVYFKFKVRVVWLFYKLMLIWDMYPRLLMVDAQFKWEWKSKKCALCRKDLENFLKDRISSFYNIIKKQNAFSCVFGIYIHVGLHKVYGITTTGLHKKM